MRSEGVWNPPALEEAASFGLFLARRHAFIVVILVVVLLLLLPVRIMAVTPTGQSPENVPKRMRTRMTTKRSRWKRRPRAAIGPSPRAKRGPCGSNYLVLSLPLD